MRVLTELARSSFDSIIVCLSYVVPKDPDLYAFTSHDGSLFRGNPRYLYKYFENKKKVIWITNNQSLKSSLDRSGAAAAYTYSLKGFWSTLRARYIFIDNGLRGPFASGVLAFLGRFKVIQTWHGAGFKNIALSDENLKGYPRLVTRALCSSFSVVLASAEDNKEQLKKAFQTESVVVSGLPRNDIFFNPALLGENYGEKLELDKFDKVILYAPTYRDDQAFSPFDLKFLYMIDKWLKENNYVLLIKKHPTDKSLKIDPGLDNIWDVTSKVGDVQELLVCTDILVTDYSSIATDFMLTGLPMIFYVYDYESYIKKNRSLYRKMDELIPGPFAYTQSELFSLLKDISWFEDASYKERYSKIRDMFHAYRDGKSCERVEKLIQDKKI